MTAAQPPPRVLVYTRQRCGLCAKAEQVVADVCRGRASFALIDIDTDADLQRRYTFRVPVVAVDGQELFDYVVDADQLQAALSRP